MMTTFLDIQPEVNEAIQQGRAVVALESTIIAHGMPYPDNMETALKVEEVIRINGAVPATIAILNGRVKIGLDSDQLETLAKGRPDVLKISRRELPYALTKNLNGATTVAATMHLAARAGIRIFATGGIGGVHRGATQTMDISADLQELANTDVAVVSAGAKAILDLRLTLEYLETFGVPVIGYNTDEFPAFYTRRSGLKVDYRLDSVAQLAALLRSKWQLGLNGGVLVANPIPESDEMQFATVNEALQEALKESRRLNIEGKDLTPFLLARIVDLTGGESLKANIALVLNNAELGARLACAFSASTYF